jgi:hypothetical protein
LCPGEALDGANRFANEVTGANWLVLPNTAALSSSEKIEPVALFPLLTKESLHDVEH